MSLRDTAFSAAALRKAWDSTRERSVEVGRSPAIARFHQDEDARLDQLARDLADQTWTSDDLTETRILAGEKQRTLHVPSVSDRIVERALLAAVTPFADPILGSTSFGYRPGLGVRHAVEAVVALREEGLGWVLHADVDDCFPSTPVGLGRRMLEATLPDSSLTPYLDQLYERRFVDRLGRRRQLRGLPQGAPLSPLLSNLVLTTLDEALVGDGFPIVRYADDFVVGAQNRDEAWEAARRSNEALSGLGMSMGTEKSEVMSFEEGFCFLGEDFGPRFPPPSLAEVPRKPDRFVVYVARQGSRVRVSKGRLLVETKDDELALDLPKTKVSRVVCFGSIGVTAGTRAWALAEDVPLVFASRRGSYSGQLTPPGRGARIERITAQLAFLETDAALSIAKAVVEAKVRKQIVVLQRFGRRTHRDEVTSAVAQMRRTLLMAPRSEDRSALMGIEGACARVYFTALGKLVPDTLRFDGRSRQPPLDVVNAALSFGYTLDGARRNSSVMLIESPHPGRWSL